MARSTVIRLGNFERDVNLVLSNTISREARQRLAAKAARKILAEAEAKNRRALGVTPTHEQYVDGRHDAPLESVNPDKGTIVFEFDVGFEMLRWIGEQLVLNSPIGSPPKDPHPGLYANSHVLLADGVEIDRDGKIPPADEYLFVNSVPYARKIERGHSPQAPEGVYEVLANIAARRFGNIAKIKFTYRSLVGAYVPLGGKRGGKTASAETRAAHEIETQTRQPAILVKMR